MEKVKINKAGSLSLKSFQPSSEERHINKSLQYKADWNKHFNSSVNNAMEFNKGRL